MDIVMSKVEVKFRRPLNDKQLEVLRLLYCYRFGTSKCIAQYLGSRDIKVLQKKLKVLEDQSLIGKRYEKAYKLQGKPAEYYLTPKGARLLMKRTDSKTRAVEKVTEQGIKNLYKNAAVSAGYMAHCLKILQVSMHFRELYGENFQFFTRMQMIPFDYLPTWRPDAFVSLKTNARKDAVPRRYFLDIWDGTRPFFVAVRKARSYLSYSEEGDWPSEEVEFPVILMICSTALDEKKLRRQMRKALDESYEEVQYATTTMRAFVESTKGKDRVWRMHDDEDETLRLIHISVNP